MMTTLQFDEGGTRYIGRVTPKVNSPAPNGVHFEHVEEDTITDKRILGRNPATGEILMEDLSHA